MKIKTISFMLSVAALLPQLTYGQDNAPSWITEKKRATAYPRDAWYTGFVEERLPQSANASKELERIKTNAQRQMAENIRANIKGSTEDVMEVFTKQQGRTFTEEVSGKSRDKTTVTSDASVVNMQTYGYHDEQGKKIYAFAAVKRSDLANYYASQIEAALSEAQRNIDMARQFDSLGKKKETFDALDESQKLVETTASYRDLLMVVDPANGISRSQGDRVNEILKAITAARMDAKSAMSVYVTGAEDMHGQKVDVITGGLLTLLSENNISIAKDQNEAGYIIKIESSVCNQRAGESFHYANVCVKVIVNNTKADKLESVLSITGPKAGGRDERNAAEKAYKAAVPKVWDAVKDRITVN